MRNLDFGQNQYTWKVNFRFSFLSNDDISNIIKNALPVSKKFGLQFIEDKTDEDESRSIQISDKKEKKSDATKLIRVFNQGIMCAAGPNIDYNEWARIRSDLCLNILKGIDSIDLSLIGALDAQFLINVPIDKITSDIFGSLFSHSSSIKLSCPFDDPTLLDFAIMLKDDIYKFYLGVDTEHKIKESPYIRFIIAFPLMEVPTDGEFEQIILNHLSKVDTWGIDVAKSVIRPLLKD